MLLELHQGGTCVYARPLGREPVRIGRAATNDVLVRASRVSGHHLVVWLQDGQVWVEDLASRNGTTVDGVTIEGPRAVPHSSVVDVAGAVQLRFVDEPDLDPADGFVLEEQGSAVQHPLRRDRVLMGPDQPIRADVPATLLVHPTGVLLGRDGATLELEVDTPFTLGERTYVVRRAPLATTETDLVVTVDYPYLVEGDVDEVRVSDPSRGREATFTGEARAALVYVLGTSWRDDQEPDPTQRGWLDLSDVASQVWGRRAHDHDPNNLHVLVHRVRKTLARAELDPWCLDSKRGSLRLRARRVELR